MQTNTFAPIIFSPKYLILWLSVYLFLLAPPLYAEEGEEGAAVEETKYFELSPPFVVNLQTNERRMRFLQVRIQVVGTPAAIAEVQTHNAPLRDIIITHLSNQTRESVNTPKKKKQLQETIQRAIEKELKALTGKRQIEGLYFTNFVIQ